MPIALRPNESVTISRSDFIHGEPCNSIRDRSFYPERDDDSDSSSLSSIGRNSDSSRDSSDREDSGEVEVQSLFKGPLETVITLEEGLPGKKGISKFYSGKSKSFTSLSDATSASSIQDIVKPEDPYAKKRKNLLAHNTFMNRSRSYASNVGEISKRSVNLGRGTSTVALSSSSSSSNSEEGTSTSISPPSCLPPLHPQAKKLPANVSRPCPPKTSPWRSYSWSDLQSVASEAHDLSGLAICSGDKGNKIR
ncbi:protein OXIDATIVE STRESS 3 LIKE 1-like [Prosopis cineraria]|uniref:protein OXIDATIVE STRESS 3 LIKE 1-like n=1 Tax=Prosopis cineraria TaxID=364024 RepID=UPI00240F1A51|nr:protein OXIDATIVE STRESS 3 LIKE 1-like [Prosopis cineraria]